MHTSFWQDMFVRGLHDDVCVGPHTLNIGNDMTQPLLLCRIAWLEYYRGPEERISGAGSENDSRFDWESYNFASYCGNVYGYVASSGNRTIDVSKLGAHDETAHGVLVVWVSVHPTKKQQRVVGWYRNATIHRSLQQSPVGRECTSLSGDRVEFHAEADELDAHLLPPDERQFVIPKGAGFMGQSNVCYMRHPNAAELVDRLRRYIEEHPTPIRCKVRPEDNYPEIAGIGSRFVEGSVRRVAVNAYERDSAARAACIAHWGVECRVCGINFEGVYGKIGKGFIHVHHRVPMSSIGREYEIDPIDDLAPVCPNCHAMLHSTNPPFSLEELKVRMTAARPDGLASRFSRSKGSGR